MRAALSFSASSTHLLFSIRKIRRIIWKRYGGFIPGIRPGARTAEYIDRVLTRLTVVGALYLTPVCLLPEFLINAYNVPFYFGGTSLLIVVNVTMDTVGQVQGHLFAHQI